MAEAAPLFPQQKYMMQDADEQDICAYLRLWKGQFISASEICRKATIRKRYDKEPKWAYPVLERLVEQKLIEADTTGHYRLIIPKRKDSGKQRHLSPEIRAILESSGKQFEGVNETQEEKSDSSQ